MRRAWLTSLQPETFVGDKRFLRIYCHCSPDWLIVGHVPGWLRDVMCTDKILSEGKQGGHTNNYRVVSSSSPLVLSLRAQPACTKEKTELYVRVCTFFLRGTRAKRVMVSKQQHNTQGCKLSLVTAEELLPRATWTGMALTFTC